MIEINDIANSLNASGAQLRTIKGKVANWLFMDDRGKESGEARMALNGTAHGRLFK